MILFLMLKVMFTTTEENKVILADATKFWIPDYQALFLGKYQHHSLCRHTQIPEKKKSKTKKKTTCDNTNNQLRHIALKDLPIMLKPNKNLSTFHAIYIVPLFKLPVKKKNNTQTLIGGERGGVWIVLFSVKLPHLRTCTQQFCCRLKKWSLNNILIIIM